MKTWNTGTRLEEIDHLLALLIKKFACDYNLSDNAMRDLNRFAELEVEKAGILKRL